jgi:hypothetical protein
MFPTFLFGLSCLSEIARAFHGEEQKHVKLLNPEVKNDGRAAEASAHALEESAEGLSVVRYSTQKRRCIRAMLDAARNVGLH